jgi:hypothetical protein
MINIKVVLNKLRMPEMKRKTKCSLRKKMQRCIDVIEKEDPEGREEAWKKLKYVYKQLTEAETEIPGSDEILEMITPIIRRYMQYDNEGVDLDTEHLTKD